MSGTTASLQRKIGGAGDLQSVVRTMKSVAASSIGQYESSVRALADYYRTVELGLGACFRESGLATLMAPRKRQTVSDAIGGVVFGSDQGLVGQFNDVVAGYAIKTLATLPGKPRVWAIGERVQLTAVPTVVGYPEDKYMVACLGANDAMKVAMFKWRVLNLRGGTRSERPAGREGQATVNEIA